MLKVVLADDEALIIDSLKEAVPWEALNLRLAGACRDGIETCNTILDENPDIVITDIQMPGLSGLELLEKIHDVNPSVEFILLSGYSEFEYARKAMQFGVQHYLLKPCTAEELEKALREVSQKILDRKAQEMRRAENQIQSLRMELLALKGAIMESVGSGNTDRFLPMENCELTFLSFSDKPDLPSLMKACGEQMQDFFMRLFFSVGNLLAIVSLRKEMFLAKDPLVSLVGKSAGPGVRLQKVETCAFTDTASAVAALLPRITHSGSLYTVDEAGVKTRLEKYPLFAADFEALLQACRKDAQTGLLRIRSFLMQEDRPEYIRMLTIHLLTKQMEESGGEPTTAKIPDFWERLVHTQDTAELVQFLMDILGDLFAEAETPLRRSFVDKTLAIIQKQYGDSTLSLKKIAENVLYMNTDYVSREFYKETGEKFSACLNRVRMEQAKELLLSAGAEDRISDIAEQVGCASPRYFSQNFKKTTGMSPSAWIVRHRGQVGGRS